ncbi:hypothetical protein Tco_1047476, partial [Tanacetum coccineum]
IQAQIKADEELAHKLQAQERERYSEAGKAKLLVQQRSYMCNYIKHIGSHTLQQLRGHSFDEIKVLFEAIVKRIGEGSEPAEESKDKESDELSEEQLQQLMIIVPEEGMNVEALQTKYPIIDWEVYTEDSRMYWKIIRVGNHTEVYQIFEDMLKNFDRVDLDKLWSLVKERFSSTDPTNDKERTLWVELKRLFEPDTDDIPWKLQRYMHDLLTWRLYDPCGVHHVSTYREHDIFILVEKEGF